MALMWLDSSLHSANAKQKRADEAEWREQRHAWVRGAGLRRQLLRDEERRRGEAEARRRRAVAARAARRKRMLLEDQSAVLVQHAWRQTLRIRAKIRQGDLLHQYQRHRLLGKVSVGGRVRQLSSRELAELRKANELRHAAIRLIRRCVSRHLRRWLARIRKQLTVAHSFDAAHDAIASMQRAELTWCGRASSFGAMRDEIRHAEAGRIQRAWRAHRDRRRRRLEWRAARRLQQGFRLLKKERRRKERQSRRSRFSRSSRVGDRATRPRASTVDAAEKEKRERAEQARKVVGRFSL